MVTIVHCFQAELLSESSISLGDLRHTKSSLRLPLNIVAVNNLNNSCETAIDNDLLGVVDSPTTTSTTSLNKLDRDYILPTPSCGSMDSLSSSSGGSSSERPMSFSTFGKSQNPFTNSHHNVVVVAPTTISSGGGNKIQLLSLPPYQVETTKIILEDCCSNGDGGEDPTRNDDDLVVHGGGGHVDDEPTSIIFIENKTNPNSIDITTSLEVCSLLSGDETTNLSKRQSDSTDEDSGIESLMRASQ